MRSLYTTELVGTIV